jgi:hypothetical protein
VKRAFILIGALAFLTALAALVARPRVPDPATNPYAGERGASLAKSAGLEIHYRRNGDEHPVDPQTVLRAGDVLRLVVRGERPRFLEVRMRDAAGPVVTVFPAGMDTTPKVAPRETLPVAPALGEGAGKVVVTAMFSDRPRAPGRPASGDVEAVTIAVDKR